MIRTIQGDAIEKLRTLPRRSVQCCVTSPPYWGLRDYGTAQWEGGNAECDHLKREGYRQDGGREQIDGFHGSSKLNLAAKPYVEKCGKCGATRSDNQIGLEKSPEAYVAKLVDVFREVRRVLRHDGTLWLNLGDSYATNGLRSNNNGSGSSTMGWPGQSKETLNKALGIRIPQMSHGLKPKDLCGIPWRVAFALQAGFSECTRCELNMRSDLWPIRNGHRICMDCLIERRKSKVIQIEEGWYLRSDIIWHKPNPMPESVTDRPTKAHEYIFLFSKNERYFYDTDAIREAHVRLWNSSNGGNLSVRGIHKANGQYRERGGNYPEPNLFGRNKRSVWTVPTMPYAEAHFATFPPKLIKPCILAGSRVGDTILDPFAGSGTTGMVAIENSRKAILIELNPKYVKLIPKRCATHLVLQTISSK